MSPAKPQAADPDRGVVWREAAWFGLALALVGAFVNSFAIWAWLDTHLSRSILRAVPLALIAPVVLWPLWRAATRRGASVRRWAWLLPAVAAAGLALAIADPNFPAKRAHVPEYILLAIVLRRALAYRLAEARLLLAAAVMAAVLGVHDELLQGLHPDRYFGLRDIVVNGLSAFAGACLGHGAALFGGAGTGDSPPRWLGRHGWVALVSALGGLALLVLALLRLPGEPLPVWAMLPPLAAAVYWTLAGRYDGGAPALKRAVTLVVWLSAAAIAAPVIANVTPLDFR